MVLGRVPESSADVVKQVSYVFIWQMCVIRRESLFFTRNSWFMGKVAIFNITMRCNKILLRVFGVVRPLLCTQ